MFKGYQEIKARKEHLLSCGHAVSSGETYFRERGQTCCEACFQAEGSLVELAKRFLPTIEVVVAHTPVHGIYQGTGILPRRPAKC